MRSCWCRTRALSLKLRLIKRKRSRRVVTRPANIPASELRVVPSREFRNTQLTRITVIKSARVVTAPGNSFRRVCSSAPDTEGLFFELAVDVTTREKEKERKSISLSHTKTECRRSNYPRDDFSSPSSSSTIPLIAVQPPPRFSAGARHFARTKRRNGKGTRSPRSPHRGLEKRRSRGASNGTI